MTDVQPRGGKYCPQCATMARPGATDCAHCGHHFSTGLTAMPPDALHQPLTETDLHRTRMFTLPPFVPRAPVSAENAPATVLSAEEVADLERALATGGRTRWNWVYVIFALAILLGTALFWWLERRL